jgi:hypothetical protein
MDRPGIEHVVGLVSSELERMCKEAFMN